MNAAAPLPRTRATAPTIALINASTLVPDAEVEACAKALNYQVDEHFSPYWGLNCQTVFVGRGRKVPKNAWWLAVMDDSDWAGALGYHDLTNDGYPAGKVFVRDAMKYGEVWTTTASHEILEMLADPYVYLLAGPDVKTGVFYCYEVCDPVQGETYEIADVLVSNFVTPAWFGTMPAYAGKYDYLGTCKRVCELRPGGYMPIWKPGSGWDELWAAKAKDVVEGKALPDQPAEAAVRSRKQVGSRHERRFVGEARWQLSEANPEQFEKRVVALQKRGFACGAME